MIVQEEVLCRWNTVNKDWLIGKGYNFTKRNDFVLVKVKDLQAKSNVKVLVKCDYCGDEFLRPHEKITRSRNVIEKDACIKCKKIKVKETNLMKYGVTTVLKLESIKKQIKKTRYGDENYQRKPHKKKKYKPKPKTKLNNRGFTYSYVNEFVKTNSECVLLSIEYVHGLDMLRFRCPCGKEFETSFMSFKHENKRQCDDCGLALRSGPNSPRWNGGVTTEYDKIRKSKKYVEWRESVFQKDNYTCQVCGDSTGGNLHAHHIKNFSEHPDLRFEKSNGCTLCDSCHNPNVVGSFHHTYGTRNNNEFQLEEYIKNKRSVLNEESNYMGSDERRT